MHGEAPGRLWKTSRSDHAYGLKKGIRLRVNSPPLPSSKAPAGSGGSNYVPETALIKVARGVTDGAQEGRSVGSDTPRTPNQPEVQIANRTPHSLLPPTPARTPCPRSRPALGRGPRPGPGPRHVTPGRRPGLDLARGPRLRSICCSLLSCWIQPCDGTRQGGGLRRAPCSC